MKKFSDEEVQILKDNKYTYSITHNYIRLTAEFKQLFLDKLNGGFTPMEAIVKFGYDPKILGYKRVQEMLYILGKNIELMVVSMMVENNLLLLSN